MSIFLTKSEKVFHNTCDQFRNQIHIVLVRPEKGANVGAAARAIANMGLEGPLRMVGDSGIVNEECLNLAKHARPRVEGALYFSSLGRALEHGLEGRLLSVGATARVGSSRRPHPMWVRNAIPLAIGKLMSREISHLLLVFGPEGSGLTNDEVRLCDWVVTIPSSPGYRSLNLAQAVLIFCYEVNLALLCEGRAVRVSGPSQKERLVTHLIKLAEEVGFILPGDPFKMKPRLEEIFNRLPNHIREVKTLHGFIEQVRRTLRKGRVEFKGRFRHAATLTNKFMSKSTSSSSDIVSKRDGRSSLNNDLLSK